MAYESLEVSGVGSICNIVSFIEGLNGWKEKEDGMPCGSLLLIWPVKYYSDQIDYILRPRFGVS